MNGLLVIDKPAGMTSHDVVDRLRRISGERSIGHLGTLDPMATGVLPLLMGKYTRLAQFFSAAEKAYSGTLRLGFSTDTYDADGEPAGPDRWPEFASSVRLQDLQARAAGYQGEIDQVPPPFSAKKIEGKPAYKLARAGKPVELKPVRITILSFAITALEGPEAEFEICVSSGGYIRSVAHAIGQELGCGAHLNRLRRTRAGRFVIEDAHSLEELQAAAGRLDLLEGLSLHPRAILPEMPSVTASLETIGRFRNGAQANLPEFSEAPLVKVFAGQRDLAGIARRVAGTLFQPVVVMS